MDFRISEWISGFQIGFPDFRVDFWISDNLDFCRQCTRFLSWRTPRASFKLVASPRVKGERVCQPVRSLRGSPPRNGRKRLVYHTH